VRFILGVIIWVVVLLAVLAGGVVAWLLVSAGVFEDHPEHDLSNELRVPARVLLRFDPDQPELRAWWDEILPERFRDYVRESIPYQGIFALAPDRAEGVVHHEMLLSTRRLSGVFNSRLNDREHWRWWAGQSVEGAGFARPGVWRVHSTYPIGGEVLAEAGRLWVKPVSGRVEIPDSDAAFALELDNRDGSAWLALASILNQGPQPGDLPREFDPIRYVEIFTWFERADGRLFLQPDGGAEFGFKLACPDEDAARNMLRALRPLRDYYDGLLAKRGAALEGYWERDGTGIVGEFTVARLREALLGEQDTAEVVLPWPELAALREQPASVRPNDIVIVRNDAGLLPLKESAGALAVIAPSPSTPDDDGEPIGTSLGRPFRETYPDATEIRVDASPLPWQRKRAMAAVEEADLIIMGVLDSDEAFVREILALGKPVMLIGLGGTAALEPFTQHGTLVYCAGTSDAHLDSLRDILTGAQPVTGKLPAPIGDLYPAGHGITP